MIKPTSFNIKTTGSRVTNSTLSDNYDNMKTMKMKIAILLMLICLAIIFIPACSSLDNLINLTIIHTSDIRSHLEMAPQRITLINQIRGENADSDVLCLDSGDMISGTPYFTLYQGTADVWFLNYTNYDVVCLGNHEFDKGPVVLANFLNEANFTVVSANVDASKEKILSQKIVPWAIIQKNGERYGIFGLTPEETSEISSPGPTINFTDHMAAARKALSDLQSRGINKIICLSNLSWDENVEMAKKLEGIDIIIGGYSVNIPGEYPVLIADDETPTVIVQAGKNGEYVGQLKVTFNKDGIVKLREGSRLIPVDYTLIADKDAAAKLEIFREPLNDLMETVIGETLVDLDGSDEHIRTGETNLGNLVADAMLNEGKMVKADIAIWNSGSVRASIPAGNITLQQVMSVLPYDNQLVVIELTGDQLISALENGVSQIEGVKGRFPLVAGLKFTWDANMPPGSRIKNVEIQANGSYQALVKTNTYKVVTSNFLAEGGDGFLMFLQTSKRIMLGATDYEVLANYISEHSPITYEIEGRITRLGE